MTKTSEKPVELTTKHAAVLHYVRLLNRPMPAEKQKTSTRIEDYLKAAFPLFPYLFPSASELDDIFKELKEMKLLDGKKPSSGIASTSNVCRKSRDFIKNQSTETRDRIPFDQIAAVLDSQDRDPNVGWLNDRLEFREQKRLDAVCAVSKEYQKAYCESQNWVHRAKLVQLFSELVGMTKRPDIQDEIQNYEGFQWYCSDGIFPNRHAHFGLVTLHTEDQHIDEQCNTIRHAVTQLPDHTILLLVIGDGEQARKLVEQKLGNMDELLLFEDDLKAIVLAQDSRAVFNKFLLKNLPPRLFSPYQFTQPVGEEIFYGRSKELRRVLQSQNKSFCLLGSRRIGKTSLLKMLQHKINEKRLLPNTVAVYVDSTHHRRIEWFQKNLLQESLETIERLQQQNAIPQTALRRHQGWIEPGSEFFEEFTLDLKETGLQFVFLIDEVDRIIHEGNAEDLEEFIRSISNEGYARFVVAGYRDLRTRISSPSSYFYNLFDTIVLGPLNNVDATFLVKDPMERLFVEFENEAVVATILSLGSTIPWLLQRMCALLLERIEAGSGHRKITVDDVRNVYDGEEFSKEMRLAVDDKNLPLIERLLVLLAAKSDEDFLTERDFHEMLRRKIYKPRFTEIRSGLDYLTSTFIFHKINGRYCFSIQQLKRKLRETEFDIEFTIDGLASEYRNKERIS